MCGVSHRKSWDKCFGLRASKYKEPKAGGWVVGVLKEYNKSSVSEESKVSKGKRSEKSGQKHNWGQAGYRALINQHKGSGFIANLMRNYWSILLRDDMTYL